jgi:dTDP-4-dehydrorhamnose 3,5-epimerase
VARRVFELAGHDPGRVSGVSTAEYFSAATNPVAPRPLYGVLDLAKVEATGFAPADADGSLAEYVRSVARAASGAG